MDYISAEFGVDSSCHFPFRAQAVTHTQADSQSADRPTGARTHTRTESQTQLITVYTSRLSLVWVMMITSRNCGVMSADKEGHI